MKKFIEYYKFVLIGFFSGLFISLIVLSLYQIGVINLYANMIEFTSKEMEVMKRMTTVSLMADPQKNFKDSRYEDKLALYEFITNN